MRYLIKTATAMSLFVASNLAYATVTTVINVPPATAPKFISGGTQLNLFEGGTLDDLFRANSGSELNVLGGTVGRFLRAQTGSVVNISGGEVDGSFRAESGSEINISGGTIAGDFQIFGAVQVTDGILTAFDIRPGGSTIVRGGSMGLFVDTADGGQMRLVGGNFEIDGTPILGLENVGDFVVYDPTEGAVLTGVLEDGTPLALSSLDNDLFAPGSLTLEAADVPPIGSSNLVASRDSLPRGLRQGQTLEVDAGASVQNHFHAARGSTVNVRSGGTIGYDLEAVDSTVNVLGGSISFGLGAFYGAVINVIDGVVGGEFNAFDGSIVNVHRGSVGQFFAAQSGSIVNISGGTIGRFFNALDGSIVNISGGRFGIDFDAFDGSTINFFGTSFSLDGVPIEGLRAGSAFEVAERDVFLSGVYPDGSHFSFRLNSIIEGQQIADSFSPNALVTITLVPEPSGAALLSLGVLVGLRCLRPRGGAL